jgi:hypothetical protein
MAAWDFVFEVANVMEENRSFPISVEAENWADASGQAADSFMQQNPGYQNGDFTSVTARLTSVRN